MLPILYNVPASARDWDVWTRSHQASHTNIVQAIQNQTGVSLTIYQLDPANFNFFEDYLNRNQQAHNDMLGALGISGSDLSEVDITQPNQLRAWIQLHAIEHRDAELALGV